MPFVVERVQVEEGFLDGLDLTLAPGLNVLIGGRGTGKTSVIELLRFCLAAPAFTTDARERATRHALSILEGGSVTVTLREGTDVVTVTRSAADETPRATGVIPNITVLAQTEIEAVGALEEGRLHLIDRCRRNPMALTQEASAVTAKLKSQTSELKTLTSSITTVDNQIEALREIPDQLAAAVAQQQALLTSISATEEDRKQLENLQRVNAALSVRAEYYDRVEAGLSALMSRLGGLRPELELESWPAQAGSDDTLEAARAQVDEAARAVTAAVELLRGAMAEVGQLKQKNDRQKITIDQNSRELRKRLSVLQEDAGVITRRVNELREREGQLQTLKELQSERQTRLSQLAASRRETYEALDELRDRRFRSRKEVADRLTDQLHPQIRVTVARSARNGAFVQAIASGLRGSGLHRSRLAPLIATTMAPLELVEAVEVGDIGAIADAVSISNERAVATIAQLREANTAEIVAAPIDDRVDLHLLDQSTYKKQDEMSIGQRCTAVLPILLVEGDDVLVVDQPEDHLDNAYITKTLVETLRNTRGDRQVIFSSHNANIPVLGEAARIVLMGSDGRRGFVEHTGPLDAPATVDAVTAVMEGGLRAFQTRAAFYGVGG